MRRTLFALLATAALVAIAWAQANNSNTWQTPGNQTVGGAVQMCPRAADNVAVPCTNAASGAGTNANGFPAGATPVMASAQGTTAGVSANLPAAVGKFTYACGFSVSVGSATTAITVPVTLAGTPAAQNWSVGAPVTAVGVTAPIFSQTFTPCVAGITANQLVSITTGALGTGGINNNVQIWGFQL